MKTDKNMKRLINYIGSLSAALLLLASCTKEPLHNLPDEQSRKVDLHFQLRVPSAGSATYAITEDDECTVNDVYVFFFRVASGTVYDVVKGTDVTTGADASKKSFQATLMVDGTVQDKFDTYVVANIESFMMGKDKSEFVGKSYAELQALLKKESIAGKLHNTAGALVMWGKADAQFPSTSSSENITVPMIRTLARVDVGVGVGGAWNGNDINGKAIPFQLKEVHIYKPNNAYSFMPLTDKYDATNKKVTAHSAIGSAQADALKYDLASGYHLTREIYIPESDVRMATDATPADANHTNRCAIVVGGFFNGSTTMTYYRIDFNDNGKPRKLIDVLRNHRYLVNIVSATGLGLPTADEAYKTIILNANIDVEITEWSDLSQDVIFDGDNWIYIQKKTFTLPGSAGAWGNLVVGSNLPTESWQMSLDGTTFSTDPTVTNLDFEVTKPTVADGGSLTIKTRNTITDQTARNATLTLKIGRLSFKIALTQMPDTPSDWENGNEYPVEF